MSLARVNASTDLRIAFDQWADSPISEISDHGAECCSTAKAWLKALDRSRRGSSSSQLAPAWILGKFPWGPSTWPIHWCEIAAAENLDCGALGDLARMIIRARGIRCLPVQVILQFSHQDAQHWASTWNEENLWAEWIVGSFAYHEVCAVMRDEQEISIWDPSDNTWISPGRAGCYGTAAAVRVFSDGEKLPPVLRWGSEVVTPGSWHLL